MSKSSTAGGAPAKRASPQRRRPVTLVFRPAQDKSGLSIKALIDGGLARLIAARIAMKLMGSHNQAADDGSSLR